MLRPDRSIECVYVHRDPIDMRKQIDGLSMLVQQAMQLNPLSGALFVFIIELSLIHDAVTNQKSRSGSVVI